MESSTIVVGYDGSGSSDSALSWAIAEAQTRHSPLRIVHVVADPTGTITGYGLYTPPDPEVFVTLGEQALATATARVREAAPEIEVESRILVGQRGAALLDNVRGAGMAVVGSRGHSTFDELLLGSTAMILATHAPCPVVVVRPTVDSAPDGAEAGRVVVGVDGSAVSSEALEFAFEEASVRHLGLSAVHAWETPFYDVPGHGGRLMDSMVVADFEGDEFRLVSESLAGWREKYPDVDVRQVVVHREPVEALVAASQGAVLLVVGSRGRGGFRSLLLGSVSHAVLHHSRCPVAVVRPVA